MLPCGRQEVFSSGSLEIQKRWTRRMKDKTLDEADLAGGYLLHNNKYCHGLQTCYATTCQGSTQV